MGAAQWSVDDQHETVDEGTGERLALAPDVVEVHRNAAVSGAVGVLASAVAIAYLSRASQSGAVVDWVLAAAMGLLGGVWLAGFIDARTPLLVADTHGIRIRMGRSWHGLPWSAVHHVEHQRRRGPMRDGRLLVEPHNAERVEADLDPAGKRHAAASRRLHGAAFAVPLGLTTRVTGAGEDLSAALGVLAQDTGRVVVVDPQPLDEQEPAATDLPDEEPPAATRLRRDVRPVLARAVSRVAALLPAGRDSGHLPAGEAPEDADLGDPVEESPDAGPVVASATPSPLRDATAGRRSEVRRDVPADPAADELTGRELRRPGSVNLVEETQAWGDRVRPIARQGEAVAPLVIDEFAVEPAEDPVVGPELAAARTRLGLTVDQLADRTRIRPHVIESIEVDDFAPCGGDFYARGHLRTLARVLGVDVTPLLVAYDERYAHAPVNPRRVFEAELATGVHGSIRGTRGGPNWSVLVAVVMAVVLAWSIARLVMDTPPELRQTTPVLNGSGGPGGVGTAPVADPVPVVVSAPAGGAHVVVRDASGEIVFKGNLAVGETRELAVSPPVRVQSTDGAVTVSLDGGDARTVGEPGVAGQGTFVPR